MKLSSFFIIIIFTAGMLVTAPMDSQGQQVASGSERWDLLMIKEAHIWKNLLVHYALADHKGNWPVRKAALEKIINKFPDSRWADDAALLLACGKVSFENDAVGALDDLQEIVRKYNGSPTIVAHWDTDSGCRIDDTWLMWQGGLVFLNADGTVRIAKPFDKNRTISQLEKEGLAYFRHLEKYPVNAAVTARLFKSETMFFSGEETGVVAALEEIVSSAAEYLDILSSADRLAALEPDGYHMWDLIMRPEYGAYLSLIGFYERQGNIDKAVEKAGELVDLGSKDGWLWRINSHIGDFYQRHSFRSKASEQYQLALSGLRLYKREMEKRSKLVKGSNLPDNFWEQASSELEKKLADNPQRKVK